MRRLALALNLCLLATSPALALETQSYTCTVTHFLDDSRYPADEELTATLTAMAISIFDAGDRLIVETMLPGAEVVSTELAVIERTADKIVALIPETEEYFEHAMTLQQAGAAVTGTLVYRTYETDNRWWFDCAAMGGERG